jgi:hypothetical protein
MSIRDIINELAAEYAGDPEQPIVYIAKGKPDTPLAGREFHIYTHKAVIRECWMSSVLYGGDPLDYLTPELLEKYPCRVEEHPAKP